MSMEKVSVEAVSRPGLKWSDLLIYLFFFFPYLGTSLPVYGMVLIWMVLVIVYHPENISFKYVDLIYLFLILGWLLYKSYQSQLAFSFILFRYYFGFFIFYFFFRITLKKMDTNQLLWLLSGSILLEALLVNTVIPPSLLPNYPSTTLWNGEPTFETRILGFYQRPYGIGNNSSVLGSLLVIVMIFNDYMNAKLGIKLDKKLKYLSYGSLMLTASGLAIVLFFVYLLLKIKPFKNIWRVLAFLGCLAGFYVLIFVFDVFNVDGYERLSSVYFTFLYEFKIMQITDVYDKLSDTYMLLFGNVIENTQDLIVTSDFAWNDLFLTTGLLGVVIILSFLFMKSNRTNIFIILIFVLGAIHYAALFSLPGQILAGYILAFTGNQIKFEKKQINLKNYNTL